MLLNHKISLDTIKINKLDLDIKLNFIDEMLNFEYDNIKIDYDIENNNINKKIYDNIFLKNYNDEFHTKEKNINSIIDKKFNYSKGIDISFYSRTIISIFISFNIFRDIVNHLFNKKIYTKKNRKIIIYYNKKIKSNIIKKITSIFDLFDYLTGKDNKYYIEIYLTDKKKIINNNIQEIGPDNINSGATLPGHYIILWRYEELHKVLIHELVHYLKLDMSKYQDKFRKIYEKINIENMISKISKKNTNPNEAYTELLALLIMSIWKYKYNKYNDISLNDYINKRLTIELGWSYHQISKIIKFFKCYEKYESLFTCSCTFKQDTNVLSYFLLKTFYLQNINIFLKEFKLKNLYMTSDKSDNILSEINLLDKSFTDKINRCFDKKLINNDISLRMTCLD